MRGFSDLRDWIYLPASLICVRRINKIVLLIQYLCWMNLCAFSYWTFSLNFERSLVPRDWSTWSNLIDVNGLLIQETAALKHIRFLPRRLLNTANLLLCPSLRYKYYLLSKQFVKIAYFFNIVSSYNNVSNCLYLQKILQLFYFKIFSFNIVNIIHTNNRNLINVDITLIKKYSP